MEELPDFNQTTIFHILAWYKLLSLDQLEDQMKDLSYSIIHLLVSLTVFHYSSKHGWYPPLCIPTFGNTCLL